MNMWYDTTSTSHKYFHGSSEVQTSYPILVHQAHLIKNTKYNLGGNILAPIVGRVLDLVFEARRGYKNTRISGWYTL